MSTEPRNSHLVTLAQKILTKQCVPFIGAGFSAPKIPLGFELARRFGNRLTNNGSSIVLPPDPQLDAITQYSLVMSGDATATKNQVAEIIRSALSAPHPEDADLRRRYALLGKLDLPIYLTTNYDDLVAKSLRSPGVEPVVEYYRWTPNKAESPYRWKRNYAPTASNPLVFHLHGHLEEPHSMVLTEDDYIDYLLNMSNDVRHVQSKQTGVFPSFVRSSIKNDTLLFLGYSLRDINFRVILRGLLSKLSQSEKKLSIAVQLEPDGAHALKTPDYLARYYEWMEVSVIFEDVGQFMTELVECVAQERRKSNRGESDEPASVL